MNETPMSPDVTSDDKLWAAIGYPIFIVAIIVLLMEDKKNRPFIKFHAVQSLALNLVIWILGMVVSVVTIGFGAICLPLVWLALLYPAYLAYQGKKFDIPVITNFIRNQGWVQ
ncbi:MAG TPA: DUF4870 domain-containing protein [Anaerolineales bacterium]